jgi:AcrR family transcriptional regulator
LKKPSTKVTARKGAAIAAPQKRQRRAPAEIMSRLMQAATDEFGEQGYSNATTAGIARRAEVTEAQLFRYFNSKAELFREAILKPLDRHLAEFNDKYLVLSAVDSADMREQSRRYITELQKFIREHWKTLMSLVVAQAYAPESVRGLSEIDSLHTYFQRNAEIMSQRVGDNPRVKTNLMVRVSFAAVLASVLFKDWIFPDGLASKEEINLAVVDFVIDGVNANLDPGFARPRAEASADES